MLRTARRRFRTALIALCALLVAQWTLAAHACPVARIAPAPVPMHGTQSPAVNPAHGCHDADDLDRLSAMAGDDQPSFVDATLCKQHCDDEGQTSGTVPAAAIDAPVASFLRVALPAPFLPLARATATGSGDANAPPLTILYCVFLT